MKICFICNEYPPQPHGGIGVFVRSLAEALVKLDVDVSVVGYGRKMPRPFVKNGVKVHWLTLPNILYKKIKITGFPYSLSTLLKRQYLSLYLNDLVRREKIDLVESHDFNGPLAYKPPCKLVVRLHGSVTVIRHQEDRPKDIHPIDRYFEKKQIDFADEVIAVSDHIARATREVLKKDFPYTVIYNGVDTNMFSPSSSFANDKQVLFVGNLMWRKGIFDLLRATPAICIEHPSVHFVVAGGVGGIHLDQLNAELASLPASTRERIEFCGNVDHSELPALYNQSAVFIFPSRVEAFGLTCAEAMACGRPVVATCSASGPELVVDGISGLLANPANPADLAEKINILLGNPELGKKLGINAHQRVLEKFDLNDLGPRNLALYQSVLQGAR